MTAPHGRVPLAETSPNGRHPAGSRAGPPGAGPEPPGRNTGISRRARLTWPAGQWRRPWGPGR